MIVDLFGLPGCGKTYFTNELKRDLSSKGVSFLDISRCKDMPLWMKICYKIADYAILVIPKYRTQRKELCDLFNNKRTVSKYVPLSFDYCVNDIVLSNLLHDFFKNKKKVYINDEGQIQRYAFLMVQFECPKEKLFSLFRKYNDGATHVYLQSTVGRAFDNIKTRNRHVCPMDELCDDALNSYLYEFYEVCESFKEQIDLNYTFKFDDLQVVSNIPLGF